MAPPATKRRKLEHSDSEAESEGSFADFGEADTGAALDASDAEDATAQSGDDMDGVEAAKEIRERFNVPVVYLTAYSDTNILERAKKTEPFGYIIKPFDEKDLHSSLEVALHRYRKEKEKLEMDQEK